MPAPTKSQIDAAMRKAFIDNGLFKREIQEDGSVVDTGTLTPEQETLIAAISEGINTFWIQWQASQTVTGSATVTTAPGVAPVTGILP